MIIPLRWHLWCLPLATVLLGTGVVYAGLHGAGLTFLIVAATGLVVAGLGASTLAWYAFIRFLELVRIYYRFRRAIKKHLRAGAVGRFTARDGTAYVVYRTHYTHGIRLWFVRCNDIRVVKTKKIVPAVVCWLRPHTGEVNICPGEALAVKNGQYFELYPSKPSRKHWKRYRQMSPEQLKKHLRRVILIIRDMRTCRPVGWKTGFPVS